MPRQQNQSHRDSLASLVGVKDAVEFLTPGSGLRRLGTLLSIYRDRCLIREHEGLKFEFNASNVVVVDGNVPSVK